ncbi:MULTISPECIES: triose-phosphate isomerase [unclassified Helicobacter]|uniref:triose-phosphate isomerase n=1 Tax=unclassified Helicobacter TaxID=2593540 RepID=UPI000CF038CC|nr:MULTISPECIES: triose-phosphate isomerase [unclassified Helicobacter]
MILAANFKSNLTLNGIREYFKTLDSYLVKKPKEGVYIFPSSFALQEKVNHFDMGIQNAYCALNGAFTGEITLEALRDFGIKNILIGHSERRNIFGESQEVCAKKFDFFAKEGFRIFYCIGESLEVRKQGQEAIESFLTTQFRGIDLEYENLIVAYEPVWAIGTGVSATTQEIYQTHNFLRSKVNKPLLYGGSVQLQNIREILSIDGVDGVLVGSAALDVSNFIEMIEIARGVSNEA